MNKQISLFYLLKEKFYILLCKAGVDRAVFWGILTKFWAIIVGPVTLLFVAFRFSPQLQGYYYTFFSIIAFQFLIELGLSSIIIQFASHEWSGLSLDRSGQIIGEKNALSRLQSLAQLFFHWYCFASIVLTLGLGICGYLFFSRNQSADINWMLPWISLCVCNGVIFCLIPIWALLEGCNQILKLYPYRFIQGMFSSLSLWIAILLGAKLWAVAISNVVVIICAGVFLLYKCRMFLKTLLFSVPVGSRINWRQDILPLQWRTTITYLIGPFAFTMFVPVLFRYYGAVVAGQMGMTLNLVSVVSIIPSPWLNPRVPQFGMLIAKKKYRDLDRVFWRTTKIFIGVAIIGAILAWFVIYILNQLRHPLAARFLPLLSSGLFILAQFVMVISTPFAIYLRVHKKEPLLFVSVISGISIGLSTFILGKHYSALGMAWGYLINILILIPIVFIIWHRCRIEWHRDEYIDAVISSSYMTKEVV